MIDSLYRIKAFDNRALQMLYFKNSITGDQYRRAVSVTSNRFAYEVGGIPGLVANIVKRHRTRRVLKKVMRNDH